MSFLCFQAAAVSVCQYLVSEVHKPVLAIPDSEVATPEPVTKVVKRRVTKKLANTTPSVAAPASSSSSSSSSSTQPQQPSSSTTPAPTPLVSQIMEMGFPRRHIEYAMQTTQSSNLERLVSWLLDHANLEVPELASPPAAPVPTPKPPTGTPTVNRQPGREATTSAAVVVTAGSDSSSDSSDYSDDEGEDEDDGDGERERERERERENLSPMGICFFYF